MEQPNNILACPFCASPGEIHEMPRGRFNARCTNNLCQCEIASEASPLAAKAVWNERAGAPAHGATDGSRLAPASWLDALRKRCERRAETLRAYYGPESSMHKEADVWAQLPEEVRADVENASNAKVSCRDPE